LHDTAQVPVPGRFPEVIVSGLPTALCASTDALVLHPGDVALVFAGDRVETLLGSCIAVILTDPRRTVAVVCHIVHSMDPPTAKARDARFAGPAMEVACSLLRSVGIVPALCEAYLYGGGNMFPDQFSARHVGAENIRWAEDFLARLAVPVCAGCVGGESYRKIVWTVGADEPAVTSFAVTQHARAESHTFPG